MPTMKKKTKTTKFHYRSSSGDLIEIQIAAIFHKPPKGLKITKALVDSMIRHKAETARGVWNGYRVVGAYEGESPKGVELKIIQWRNPDRLAEEDQSPRSDTQAEAWGSLRGPISSGAFRVGSIGNSGGV